MECTYCPPCVSDNTLGSIQLHFLETAWKNVVIDERIIDLMSCTYIQLFSRRFVS